MPIHEKPGSATPRRADAGTDGNLHRRHDRTSTSGHATAAIATAYVRWHQMARQPARRGVTAAGAKNRSARHITPTAATIPNRYTAPTTDTTPHQNPSTRLQPSPQRSNRDSANNHIGGPGDVR